MNYLEKLKKLMKFKAQNEHAERIVSELAYLDGVSKNDGNAHNEVISLAADYLLKKIDETGAITANDVTVAEELLSPLSEVAKKYTLLFVGHAHIDMNWMWGYHETASITVDTFRTLLDLMEEFPEMTFAQSQASTYEIIEKYAPEMLEDIKAHIKSGRWEVTATEWVEPDNNMPNGESLTRQILQAKKYLSGLLDISQDSICVNFVPDTFGHNANIPEILSNAGVKYMYHCRGFETPHLYKFVAPSGKEILAYREYAWYNADIVTEKLALVPKFCDEYGTDTMLCVYGVGDHGGGPTRRDVTRILTYRDWPYAPTIRFGTYREFFEAVERKSAPLARIDHELNDVFTGCYTTQSRIKLGNRTCEVRLSETEAITSMDSLLTGAPHDGGRLDNAWRNLLFNHFHDILPGSGTIETREFAMGRYQEALAATTTTSSAALRHIVSELDSSQIEFDCDDETTAEGGGVGFYASEKRDYRMSSTERGRGKVRAFCLSNPTPYARDEYAEITVWDYKDSLSDLEVRSATGEVLPHRFLKKKVGYWSHQYSTMLVKVALPPYGYTTVVLGPKHSDGHLVPAMVESQINDDFINDEPIVLENSKVKAVFDRATMELVSFVNKETGKTLIDKPSCYFRFAKEDAMYGMTSWRIGPLTGIKNLNRTKEVKITQKQSNSALKKVYYQIKFGASELLCKITLKEDSPTLQFQLIIDWHEDPTVGVFVPQLSFVMPHSVESTGEAIYDIPYGILKRPAAAHDVPSLSFVGVDSVDEDTLALISDCKYGFRYNNGEASVTLIRSAYEPDPFPDRGNHRIRLGVSAVAKKDIKREAELFNRPISHSAIAKAHKGSLALEGSALSVSENVTVSAVKCAEDGCGVAVRLYETEGKEETATVTLCRPIKKAYLTDTNESILSTLDVEGCSVDVECKPYAVTTVKIEF